MNFDVFFDNYDGCVVFKKRKNTETELFNMKEKNNNLQIKYIHRKIYDKMNKNNVGERIYIRVF